MELFDWSGVAAIDPRFSAHLESYCRLPPSEQRAADKRPRVEASMGGPVRGSLAGVQIITVHGPITARASMFSAFFGGTALDALQERLYDCLRSTDTQGVLLHVDSPGGGVYGLDETAAVIAEVAARKPVVVHVAGLAASAAYWLASAGTRIIAAPSSEVGSIGVYGLHLDISKNLEQEGIKPTIVKAGEHKAEANPYQPLSAADREAMQDRIDTYHNMFVRRVAKGRGVSVDVVRRKYGQGRVLSASNGLSAGMVDSIGTLETALSSLRGELRGSDRPARSAASLQREFDAAVADASYDSKRLSHKPSPDADLRLRVRLAQLS